MIEAREALRRLGAPMVRCGAVGSAFVGEFPCQRVFMEKNGWVVTGYPQDPNKLAVTVAILCSESCAGAWIKRLRVQLGYEDYEFVAVAPS